MDRMELRLTGSGGQGVILATIILAEAALFEGKNAVQSQSYGPEARGGMCKAEVIISENEIGFTKVMNPTFLLALTQESLNKYGKDVNENCIIMMDDSLQDIETKASKIIKAPILATAREKVGKAFTANIVAVGAIGKALNLASFEELKEAVMGHIPAGTEEINIKALEMGYNLI